MKVITINADHYLYQCFNGIDLELEQTDHINRMRTVITISIILSFIFK